MKLAGIAGLVAMLVFALPASAGRDETALERQVRIYLESHGRYHQVLGVSDDAGLGRVVCGRAGSANSRMCAFAVDEVGLSGYEMWHRYFVSGAPAVGFSFHECPRGVRSGEQAYRPEDDPCADVIDRG